jgi:hypothetical protein
MAPPMKPPPDTWEETVEQWKSLNRNQRKGIINKSLGITKKSKENKPKKSTIRRSPPATWEGSNAQWTSLTSSQRCRAIKFEPPEGCAMSLTDWRMLTEKKRCVIRKSMPVVPKTKKQQERNAKYVPKIKHLKLIPPPPEYYLGTLVEWNLLEYTQRYKILNREEIRIKANIWEKLPKNKDRSKDYKKKSRAKIQGNPMLKAASKAWFLAYRQKNQDYLKTTARAYRLRNMNRISARQLQYRLDNKTSIAARDKAYHALHSKRINSYRRKWGAENVAHVTMYNRAYSCRQAADWWEKWGSAEARAASKKALELENNRNKPWAGTWARDRAVEASYNVVGGV